MTDIVIQTHDDDGSDDDDDDDDDDDNNNILYYTGSQTTYAVDTDRAIVNGAHKDMDLQVCLA